MGVWIWNCYAINCKQIQKRAYMRTDYPEESPGIENKITEKQLIW